MRWSPEELSAQLGGPSYTTLVHERDGKVQGLMMKSWATRVPLPLLDGIARRSVEWVVMAEDLPDPQQEEDPPGLRVLRRTRLPPVGAAE